MSTFTQIRLRSQNIEMAGYQLPALVLQRLEDHGWKTEDMVTLQALKDPAARVEFINTIRELSPVGASNITNIVEHSTYDQLKTLHVEVQG